MPTLVLICLAMAQSASAEPNITSVLADELGWNDFGYHGSEIQTADVDAGTRCHLDLD